jgi:CRISPR system Cascade subunit CasA
VLWTALAALFANGSSDFSDSTTEKASLFTKPFEQHEDARFFDDPLGLNEEVESEHPENIRLSWYLVPEQKPRFLFPNSGL